MRYDVVVFNERYDALMEIFDDTGLNNSSGYTSRTDAKTLADTLCKFKFIVSLVT